MTTRILVTPDYQDAPNVGEATSSPESATSQLREGTLVSRWLARAGMVADRLASGFAEWYRDITFEDSGWSAVCRECGKACANVTSLPTSRPCAGVPVFGQCAVCVGIVEAVCDDTGKWHCVASRYHFVTNPQRRDAS